MPYIIVSTISPTTLHAEDQILVNSEIYTVLNAALDPEDADKQRWIVSAISNSESEYVVVWNVHETTGFKRLTV